MRERNVKKINEFYETLLFNVESLRTLKSLSKLDAAVRFTFDKLDVIKNELAMIDENWCDGLLRNSQRRWRNVRFIIQLQTKRNQRAQISVEISPEHFLPNNRKPETSRGRAQGRVFIVVATNI